MKLTMTIKGLEIGKDKVEDASFVVEQTPEETIAVLESQDKARELGKEMLEAASKTEIFQKVMNSFVSIVDTTANLGFEQLKLAKKRNQEAADEASKKDTDEEVEQIKPISDQGTDTGVGTGS